VRRLAGIAVTAAVLAGCGEARTRPPDVGRPADPRGSQTVALAGAGASFTGPANWRPVPSQPPLEGGLRSGTATVAVWRYPRSEPLPADRDELEQARTRLLERVRQRNPTFVVRTSELTRLGGASGILLTGRQTVGGRSYDVRSAHLFKAGAEVVVDAYARPADFARVDRAAFQPLMRSLRLEAVR